MAAVGLARLIAGGLGCGHSPWAPGTVGSLAAVAAAAGLLALSPWLLAGAAVAATLGGIVAIDAAQAGDDPGWVVIDEVAGMWITALALPAPTWRGLVAAFVLFRVLDIAKPGPIGWADRRGGAVAVMGDDVIAGLIGAALLVGLRMAWPGLLD